MTSSNTCVESRLFLLSDKVGRGRYRSLTNTQMKQPIHHCPHLLKILDIKKVLIINKLTYHGSSGGKYFDYFHGIWLKETSFDSQNKPSPKFFKGILID